MGPRDGIGALIEGEETPELSLSCSDERPCERITRR